MAPSRARRRQPLCRAVGSRQQPRRGRFPGAAEDFSAVTVKVTACGDQRGKTVVRGSLIKTWVILRLPKDTAAYVL